MYQRILSCYVPNNKPVPYHLKNEASPYKPMPYHDWKINPHLSGCFLGFFFMLFCTLVHLEFVQSSIHGDLWQILLLHTKLTLLAFLQTKMTDELAPPWVSTLLCFHASVIPLCSECYNVGGEFWGEKLLGSYYCGLVITDMKGKNMTINL